MANHTLTVANLTAPFRRRGSLRIPQCWYGRSAEMLTWKPVYSQYQIAADVQMALHVVRKYTTASAAKGFVDEGVRSTMKIIKSF